MKKALILATSALAIASMPALGAYAIDSRTHDVTVGGVDQTVYSVDISWGENMVYDWKYNESTGSYGFKARLGCRGWSADNATISYLTALANGGGLYSDETCETPFTGTVTEEGFDQYYAKDNVGGRVWVYDNSQNGKVSATASFTPTEKYNWVEGKFANFANVTAFGDILYYDSVSELADNTYPIGPSINTALCVGGCDEWVRFEKTFYLEKAAGANVDSQSISTSDKIGTITINIAPDYSPND